MCNFQLRVWVWIWTREWHRACVSDTTQHRNQEKKRGRRHLSPILWQVCNNSDPVSAVAEFCALWREEASAAPGVAGYGSAQMKYFIAVRFPARTDRGVRSPNIYWSNCRAHCPAGYCVWNRCQKRYKRQHRRQQVQKTIPRSGWMRTFINVFFKYLIIIIIIISIIIIIIIIIVAILALVSTAVKEVSVSRRSLSDITSGRHRAQS